MYRSMKSVNETVDAQYYDLYEGFNRKAVVRIEYLDDDGIWQNLDDVLNFSISLQSEDDRMGVYTLVPPAASLSLSILNTSNQYTPDASGTYDGVIAIGRRVRVRMSYDL